MLNRQTHHPEYEIVEDNETIRYFKHGTLAISSLACPWKTKSYIFIVSDHQQGLLALICKLFSRDSFI